MKLRKTDRGFERIDFFDCNGLPVSLQQSSAIGDRPDDAADRPGSSRLWLGRENDRAHLDYDQVAELRDRLAAWLETGSLRLPADPEPSPPKED